VPETWANYGDLHLDLTGSRIRSQLEAALRDAVRSGRLHPGTRLPPSRVLAADLGIARNTVADAYGQLVAEGWLGSRSGSGTWVTGHSGSPAAQAAAVAALRHHRFDLRAGVPDLSAFPRQQWQAAARRALGAAPHHALGYPDPRGLPELRVALAGYLARVRGVDASPERVVICGGFTHGIALLCRVLRARGARAIGVEAYGHLHHRRIAEAHGLRPIPLPVDAGGARPDALHEVTGPGPARSRRLAAGAVLPSAVLPSAVLPSAVLPSAVLAGAVLLTPAHQFPLGVTLQPERRRAFAQWASRTGGLVIEDDYDGEFRYDRQPVGAMQALAPESVVYAGTASKSLVPGLQLGWLVVPAQLVDEVIEAKEATGSLISALDQLTLAEFIACGGYDRQIRHMRLTYRRRRDRLITTLRQQAPGVTVTGISAGLHALVRLAAQHTERDVIALAAGHGLAVDGLGSYRAAGDDEALEPDGSPGGALVVGYARPPDHAFTAALARLCAVLSSA
jgi:GntR family transcriptional regulator/MocR family aminotransferase